MTKEVPVDESPSPDRSMHARVRCAPLGTSPPDVLRCPDCVSEYSITEVRPGLFEAHVRHDPGCPWLAGLERDLS